MVLNITRRQRRLSCCDDDGADSPASSSQRRRRRRRPRSALALAPEAFTWHTHWTGITCSCSKIYHNIVGDGISTNAAFVTKATPAVSTYFHGATTHRAENLGNHPAKTTQSCNYSLTSSRYPQGYLHDHDGTKSQSLLASSQGLSISQRAWSLGFRRIHCERSPNTSTINQTHWSQAPQQPMGNQISVSPSAVVWPQALRQPDLVQRTTTT